VNIESIILPVPLNVFNVDFRQKFVTTFDAHADARSAISEMTSCCTNSPNQPMCNLTDVMLSKYYPGARITVLMVHEKIEFDV
jgi:hypothetical protein